MLQYEFFVDIVILPAAILSALLLLMYLVYYLIFGAHSPFSDTEFEYPSYISKPELAVSWVKFAGNFILMGVLYVTILTMFLDDTTVREVDIPESIVPLMAVTIMLAIILVSLTFLSVFMHFAKAMFKTMRFRQQRKDVENHKIRQILSYEITVLTNKGLTNEQYESQKSEMLKKHEQNELDLIKIVEGMIDNNTVFHLSNRELVKVLLIVSQRRPDLMDDVNRLYYKNFGEVTDVTADPKYNVPETHENYKSSEQVKQESQEEKGDETVYPKDESEDESENESENESEDKENK